MKMQNAAWLLNLCFVLGIGFGREVAKRTRRFQSPIPSSLGKSNLTPTGAFTVAVRSELRDLRLTIQGGVQSMFLTIAALKIYRGAVHPSTRMPSAR